MNICFKIFLSFIKVSMFTFGGGYAMIPLIKSEIIEKNGWISEEELTDIITMSQVMPGLIYISTSTFIGYKVAGIFGAICASVAVLVPSALVMMILALLLDNYYDKEIVKNIFIGIICGVTALTIGTLIELFKKIVNNKVSLIIFVLSLLLVEIVNIKAYIIIGISILFGTLYSYLKLKRGRRIID